jgi:rfaE bifunctional protein kinase chain/domain
MTAPISRARLAELLDAIRHLTIGILGDFTLDGYWYADMTRSELSRETPLYPRPIVRETYSLGGSANVAWNVAALGTGSVLGFSVLGEDWRGALLRGLLQKEGIHTEGMLVQQDRETPFYGKVVLTAAGRCRQEDARLDFINTHPVNEKSETAILQVLEDQLPNMDALIVADYQAQGVVTPRVTQGLLKIAQSHPDFPVVVDSRERAAEFRSLILKPNDIEAARLFFPDRDPASVPQEDLKRTAIEHTRKTGKPIVITIGEKGCLVCAEGACQAVPGVHVSPPIDTVGAGDAFMASFTAALAAGAAPYEAACVANLSAAITVTQVGVTGTASPAQVLDLYDQWVAQLA